MKLLTSWMPLVVAAVAALAVALPPARPVSGKAVPELPGLATRPTRTDVLPQPNGDLILQYNHADRQDKPSDSPVPSRTRIWIPGDVRIVRGIIFDLGYSYTADRSDLQAVAREQKLAVVSCLLRYKGGTELLNRALADFAERSRHPELVNVPIIPMGFSRNGSRAFTFLAENRDKTLALALGGNPGIPGGFKSNAEHLALAKVTPILTVVGSRDPFVDYDKGEKRFWHVQHYPAIRAYDGVTWGMMIGWGYGHGWEGSWVVFAQYFDDCIRLRLPAGDPRPDGKAELRPIAFDDGWFAAYGWDSDWPEIAPVKTFTGDKTKAVWLPSEDLAAVWRAFNVKSPKVKLAIADADATATDRGASPAKRADRLTLTADAPTTATAVEFYDRATLIGRAEAAPYVLTTDRLGKGFHTVYAVALTPAGRTPSRPQTVVGGRAIDWKRGDADQKRADSPESIALLTQAERGRLLSLLGGASGTTRPAAAETAALRARLQELTTDPFVEQRSAAAALLKKLPTE